MTGRGRPPIGPPIKIRLESDVLELVDRYSKEAHTSRAEAVRHMIHEFFGLNPPD